MLKPENKKSNPTEKNAGVPTRRECLCAVPRLGWKFGGAAAAIVGLMWSLAGFRFCVPNASTRRASKIKAGRPGDYPVGTVDDRYRDSHGVWIVHSAMPDGGSELFALSTICTHLGCITIWIESERKFKCPCHGSGFDSSGLNIEGPAPRPLERCAVRLTSDGRLEIDAETTFRPETMRKPDPRSRVKVDAKS